MENQLKGRYSELVERQIQGADSDVLFDEFSCEYSSMKRGYHNFLHVNELLEEFDSVKHFLENPDVVEMAVFVHDWRYDINKSDNEKVSAKLGEVLGI